MKRSRRSVTIHDVAAAAGVSVSTVSRVLNEKDDVAYETVEKVQRIIHDLGYVSSLAARGMRSHRTNVIGLIMPDVASPYSIEVLQGVNRGIARHDYDLIIYTNGDISKYNTADQERHFVMLLNGTITDGVVVVAGATTRFSTDAPVVIIDPADENPNFPAIIGTNREGALLAMNYLIGLGHRRIGYITGRPELLSAAQRIKGYQDGLTAFGIPLDEELIRIGDYTTETAYQCARELLALPNPPTAIFAANDMSAVGVYQAAKDRGLCIPKELSVVGFDNLRETSYLHPALTTIDQFIADSGTLAIEMMVALLKGEKLQENMRKMPTQLVERESCCAIR